MSARLTETHFEGSLAERIAGAKAKDAVLIYWLGQAGFLLIANGRRILIDPYLSDSLAEKYRGKSYPHIRMMPAPATISELGAIDLVLVTHEHTDHMDPATLAPIAEQNSNCRFVVPLAAMERAMECISTEAGRLTGLDVGDTYKPFEGCTITAVRAAHEALQRTSEGWYRFLGYVIALGPVTIYHSGDTVPFEGQEEEVTAFSPDLALLPVNGRSAELLNAGIAGNLTLEEARLLAGRIGAPMIAHHYGMFEFNTASPEDIDQLVGDGCAPRVHRAKTGVEYRSS